MNRFKELRVSKGLKQRDVAEYFGISQVSVWQWENGVTLPRAALLPLIARLYGCTIDELLQDEAKEG